MTEATITDPNSEADPAADPAAGGADPKAGAGDGGASWLDGLNLPDDLRKNPEIAKYAADPQGMMRGMIHLRQHMGAPPEQILRLPKPDDAEGLGRLWNTLGRPEAPDKYGVKLPEGATGLDQAGLESFLAAMHKTGPFTGDMAKGAVEWMAGWAADQAKAQAEAVTAARAEAAAGLKKDWGAKYDANLDAVAEVVEAFGDQDYVAYLKESGLGGDPRHLKFLLKLAEARGEPSTPDPSQKRGGGGSGLMTPAEAEAELAKFSDPSSVEYKALNDSAHAQHDFYVKRRSDLFQFKRGGAPR